MIQTNSSEMAYMQKKEKISINEFLFVLYFCSFSFLKPMTTISGSFSTIILLAAAAIILLVGFIHNGILLNINLAKFILFIASFMLIFLPTFVFFNNPTVLDNIYSFCIYGIIPLLLLINVRDYSMVLKYWVYMTIIVGFMFLLDPFFGYRWSGGYMPLGFNQLLPAFASSVVIWLHYRKKWGFVLAAIFLLAMLIFANKGSFLTAIAFFMIFFLYMKKQRTKLVATIIAGILLLIVIYQLRFEIFDLFYDFALSLGVPSYSMATFKEMLYISPDRIFSERTNIWGNCIVEIQAHPLFGIGIGSFQYKYKLYPHNVFLDILTSVGWIAFIIFIVILLVSIFSIRKNTTEKRVFMTMMLILWILPMQISLNMWNYAIFWIYFGTFMFKEKPVDYSGGQIQ